MAGWFAVRAKEVSALTTARPTPHGAGEARPRDRASLAALRLPRLNPHQQCFHLGLRRASCWPQCAYAMLLPWGAWGLQCIHVCITLCRLSSTDPPRSTIMATEIFTPGAVYTLFNGQFGTVMEFDPSNGLVQAGTFAHKSCQQVNGSCRIPLIALIDLILEF